MYGVYGVYSVYLSIYSILDSPCGYPVWSSRGSVYTSHSPVQPPRSKVTVTSSIFIPFHAVSSHQFPCPEIDSKRCQTRDSTIPTRQPLGPFDPS